MIYTTTVQALEGQARLAGLHDQARRDALISAARRARRAHRQRSWAVRLGMRIPRRKTLPAAREG